MKHLPGIIAAFFFIMGASLSKIAHHTYDTTLAIMLFVVSWACLFNTIYYVKEWVGNLKIPRELPPLSAEHMRRMVRNRLVTHWSPDRVGGVVFRLEDNSTMVLSFFDPGRCTQEEVLRMLEESAMRSYPGDFPLYSMTVYFSAVHRSARVACAVATVPFKQAIRFTPYISQEFIHASSSENL